MAHRPHLLFVVNTLEVGGCERHLSIILPHLKKTWNLRVVIFGPKEGPFAKILRDEGIEVTVILKGSFWLRGGLIQRIFSLIRRFLFLRKCLHSHQITHFFLPLPYIVGMIAALTRRKPGVLLMARRALNDYQTALLRWLEPQLHKYAHGATGNSQAIINQLAEEGIPEEKRYLIYNATLFDDKKRVSRQEVRQFFEEDEKTLVIAHVANLRHGKGHEDLVRSLTFLPEACPVKVWCIGRDEGSVDSLKKMAKTLKVDHRVRFFGQREDVPFFLSGADAGLSCSHHEGFSNAILEKMAFALPMIATDVGGNPEMVVPGETGWIVPPRNPQALAEAFVKLWQSPEKRVTMGLAGQNRLKTLFSLEECLRRYEALYQKMSDLFLQK